MSKHLSTYPCISCLICSCTGASISSTGAITGCSTCWAGWNTGANTFCNGSSTGSNLSSSPAAHAHCRITAANRMKSVTATTWLPKLDLLRRCLSTLGSVARCAQASCTSCTSLTAFQTLTPHLTPAAEQTGPALNLHPCQEHSLAPCGSRSGILLPYLHEHFSKPSRRHVSTPKTPPAT